MRTFRRRSSLSSDARENYFSRSFAAGDFGLRPKIFPLRPTPKHKAVRKMKTSSTQGSILRRSGLERVYIPGIYIAFVPLGS